MSENKPEPEEKPPQLNFNTALLGFIAVLLAVISFFSKYEFESIKRNQEKVWEVLMPRSEIELKIQEIKTSQESLRAKQTEIEITLARMQRK